jgi:hypothetical protein
LQNGNQIAPQPLYRFHIQLGNYSFTEIIVPLLMRGGSHLLIPQDLIILTKDSGGPTDEANRPIAKQPQGKPNS